MVYYQPEFPDDPGDPGNPGGTPNPPSPANYGTAVWSFNFNKLDAASAVEVLAYLNCYNQDDLQFSVYMFLDDGMIQVGTINLPLDNRDSKGQCTMTCVTIVEGLAAGSHKFELRVKNRETEGPVIVQAGSIVKITELRQAGR